MKGYNGYRNYNAWNVSLWINNDETLYKEARRCVRISRSRLEAVVRFIEFLDCVGLRETPDGVPFTKTNIRIAMRGM